MCGIFAVLSSDIKDNGDFEKQNFHKGKNRGPENSVFKKVNDKTLFGFHRLAYLLYIQFQIFYINE